MTEKKRRIHRRITKKNPIKGGAKNFFCRDIVKAYKNKVIYLGVDLNWIDLFPAFSYDLIWNDGTVPAPGTAGTGPSITFTMTATAGTGPSITFTMTAPAGTPIKFNPNDFSKIDEAIETYLKPYGSDSKWYDDNDKTQNSFKYNLNNVMLPRYTSNKNIGNGDNNTQIAEISSPFLHWKKESGIVSNTNQIEDEQKNVIVSGTVNEKGMMTLIHEKLLDFKLKMKRVLIDTFKQRVRKNIQNIIDIMETKENTKGSIKRNCKFSVSGKIYFGIKVVCNSYTNFELQELIIPDPVIPVMDDLPSQGKFSPLRKAVIDKFIKQNEENIKIHMEDLDGLLMFGSTQLSSGVGKPNRKGNYGKHNIHFNDHTDNTTGTGSKPDYNPESLEIFKILRKTRQ